MIGDDRAMRAECGEIFIAGPRMGGEVLPARQPVRNPTMSSPAQTYANHRAMPSPAFMGAALILVVNVVWQAIGAFSAPGFGSVLAVLVALALIVVWFFSRRSAQVVQDRLIRLEMRLRLERVLSAERHADIAKLSVSQLVGLRFASDGELPALVQETLAQSLTNDAIKKKITAWQADWLRV